MEYKILIDKKTFNGD